jgi:hypothetical protein
MPKTVSGHQAITSWSSPMLAARDIPGTKISLRTRRVCLPLFLHLASRLNLEVKPLLKRNTWSFNFRQIRMGDAVSDHAGYAIDCWSDDIGAHVWPSRMPVTKARMISKILESYKTAHGSYIFGWGASDQAGGVVYKGPTYHSTAANDPMHFFIAEGVTTKDMMFARKVLGIRPDGETSEG